MAAQMIIELKAAGAPVLWAFFWLVVAGMLNGWLDRLADPVAFGRSIFHSWPADFWLKTESWKNKYKRYKDGAFVVARFDKNNRPVYKRRFWGSTTLLIFLTDGWHLIQFLQWTAIAAACVSLTDAKGWVVLLGFVVFKGAISGGFSITYDLLFKRRS